MAAYKKSKLNEKDVKFLSKVSVYPALGCSCILSEKRKRIENGWVVKPA